MNAPCPPSAVIVVSSHVARGSVGNRAAVFALERLGLSVWAVPTVTLPWHPGHGSATRIVPEPEQFRALVNDLGGAPWLGEVGAVLSGYLGDAAQAGAIAALVARVKRRNPRALYFCDPVIGDAGGLYVPQATADAVRERLLSVADIASPNRFELGWLTGLATHDLSACAAAARRAGPDTVLVTSAPTGAPERTGNLLLTSSDTLLAEHPVMSCPPHGLGDLTAALLLARLLEGATPTEALRNASAAVLDMLSASLARGADELTLAADAHCLAHPASEIVVRRLGTDGRPTCA